MQRFFSLFLIGVLGITSSQIHAQPAEPKGSVDAMVNWDNPWDLTPAKFTEIADALPKKKSDRAYNTQMVRGGEAVMYSIGLGTVIGSSGGGKINLFNGALQVDSVTVVFEKDKLRSFSFNLGVAYGIHDRKPSAKDLEKFKTEIARVTGDKSPKPYDIKVGPGNAPRSGMQWTHLNYNVQMFEYTVFSPTGRAEIRKGIYTVKVLPLEPK